MLGALGGQAVVSGAETAAGTLSLVLEADAPVGAWDATAIGLDADGPEEVKSSLTSIGIAVVYAINSIHGEARYAKQWQASSLYESINTGISAELCQAVPRYAKR